MRRLRRSGRGLKGVEAVLPQRPAWKVGTTPPCPASARSGSRCGLALGIHGNVFFQYDVEWILWKTRNQNDYANATNMQIRQIYFNTDEHALGR